MMLVTSTCGPARPPTQKGTAVIYIVPTDPTSPVVSFPALRKRARRIGFRIASDRFSNTFSLIESQTGLPFDRARSCRLTRHRKCDRGGAGQGMKDRCC